MTVTATQWIWRDSLSMPPFLPERAALAGLCWLCGGATEAGWPLKAALSGAFTDHNLAAVPHSPCVCDCCVALMRKEAWVSACERHGHSPYFPIVEGKAPFLSNWMFSSHCFSGDGWRRPSRAEVRDILLHPPRPPFVISLALVGKKHVLFRAPLNHARERFGVQADENTLTIDHARFTDVLTRVEYGLALGLSRDGMQSGRYHPAAMLAAGAARWRDLEQRLATDRRQSAAELLLACYAAHRHEAAPPVQSAPEPAPEPTPTIITPPPATPTGQLSMF